MTDSPLARKLLVRANHRMLILNPPDGFVDRLDPLPEGTMILPEPDGVADVLVLFVRNRAELQRDAARAVASTRRDGALWLAFPKGTSKVKTDLGRDAGWDAMTEIGYVGVSLISIDDTWSAFRFRPVALVGSKRAT